MDQNPYQAPQSQINIPSNYPSGSPIPAGKGVRFLNFIIDYFSYLGLCMVVGFVVGAIGSIAALEIMQEYPMVFGMIMYMIYFAGMEIVFGRTVGKLITGTRVVNASGEKPSVGQILGRTLARFIPFEPFSFLGSEGRGWHDSLSDTFVVKCR